MYSDPLAVCVELVHQLGILPSLNDPWSTILVIQFLVVPSTCEVSLGECRQKFLESTVLYQFNGHATWFASENTSQCSSPLLE